MTMSARIFLTFKKDKHNILYHHEIQYYKETDFYQNLHITDV